MFAALNAFLTRSAAGYFLSKSLRFRSSASAYLSKTYAATSNRQTWTWSGWVKRGTLGGGQTLFGLSSNAGSSGVFTQITWDSDQLSLISFNNSVVEARRTSTALYRDPAAWYHVVCVFDTTNATAANRLMTYINGVQITSFSSSVDPAQNYNGYINGSTTFPTTIGELTYSGNVNFFDGELAEVYFVDGQALAPTSFGAYSIYNQWLPIKYAGTYGTNGFYLPFSATSATSYAGSFNGSSQYLSVAKNTLFEPAASQAWTLEAWVYPTSTTDAQIYFYGSPTVVTGNDIGIYAVLGNSSTFIGGGFYNGTTAYAVNTSILAPLNTWTHVAVVSTGSVLTVYGNGVSGGSVSTSLAPNAPALATARIGYYETSTSRYFPGQISNVRFVKGTAVYTANFVPPTAPLTAITNTSLLTLQSATVVDNSGNSLAITNTGTVATSVQSPFLNPRVLVADSSGNANNWTPNNISLTTGSTYDSLTDVPTLTSATVANYAVLNPLTLSYGTLSEANLKYVGNSANHDMIVATLAQSTGKWYFETTLTSSTSMPGVVNLNSYTPRTNPTYPGGNAASWGYYPDSVLPGIYNNNIKTDAVTASASGDIIGTALDCDAGTISWYKNNSLLITKTIGAGNWGFVVGHLSANCVVNFGQRPFTYTPPTGFLALNTFNI